VQNALGDGSRQCFLGIGEQQQRERRWQGEGGPGGEGAEPAASHEAEGKSDFAAAWARQKLAQRDQIGIRRLIQPAAANDELFPEVADVGDRSAERGQAEFGECRQHLARRSALTVLG